MFGLGDVFMRNVDLALNKELDVGRRLLCQLGELLACSLDQDRPSVEPRPHQRTRQRQNTHRDDGRHNLTSETDYATPRAPQWRILLQIAARGHIRLPIHPRTGVEKQEPSSVETSLALW